MYGYMVYRSAPKVTPIRLKFLLEFPRIYKKGFCVIFFASLGNKDIRILRFFFFLTVLLSIKDFLVDSP